MYQIRHSDKNENKPSTVEKSVTTNFFGTIISNVEFVNNLTNVDFFEIKNNFKRSKKIIKGIENINDYFKCYDSEFCVKKYFDTIGKIECTIAKYNKNNIEGAIELLKRYSSNVIFNPNNYTIYFMSQNKQICLDTVLESSSYLVIYKDNIETAIIFDDILEFIEIDSSKETPNKSSNGFLKCTKKFSSFEFVQWNGDNYEEIRDFTFNNIEKTCNNTILKTKINRTTIRIEIGSYIVRVLNRFGKYDFDVLLPSEFDSEFTKD